MAQSGIKRVDVMCPGFTGDCLETLEEMNDEAREAFMHAGGETFHYISCLNDSPEWAEALTSICEQQLSGWPTLQAPNVTELAKSRAEAIALGAKV
jgi:ferrochelatase